jgi:hypothetical protein
MNKQGNDGFSGRPTFESGERERVERLEVVVPRVGNVVLHRRLKSSGDAAVPQACFREFNQESFLSPFGSPMILPLP